MQNKQNAAMPHSHWIKDKRLRWISQFYYILHEKFSSLWTFCSHNVHLHSFKCFPLLFFKYYCQAIKRPKIPSFLLKRENKSKSDAPHTHTRTHIHTSSINMLLMELKGFSVTISYPKLNDWRIYCRFIVCQMSYCVTYSVPSQTAGIMWEWDLT